MISVDEALIKIFALLKPLDTEVVPLRAAAARVLANPAIATRDQPPFDTSVMDGYGIFETDPVPGSQFKIIGEAAAGHAFGGRINAGEAIRIFTGAPVPEGVTRVIIQEDVTRVYDAIELMQKLDSSLYIRKSGVDFKVSDELSAPRRLSPADLSLIASMNIPEVTVFRRPNVALIATGDELVMPGEAPAADQIIASNAFGLAALIEAAGGTARVLPIARDTEASLQAAFDLAKNADLIVTIGGASVGDHDLVGSVADGLGMKRAFYKVAMRPGKPLMAGMLNGVPMICLPGNPVSSMICGYIFIPPALAVLQGLPGHAMPRQKVPLGAAVTVNGPREHYMRATHANGAVIAADRQDSGLQSVLAHANALIVRPPNDGAKEAGELVDVIALP